MATKLITSQYQTSGSFRYRNFDDLVFEQHWHVQGTVMFFDEPIWIDMRDIDRDYEKDQDNGSHT